MNVLPDAATLDALVIGAEDSEDHAAWEAVVRIPGGAEAWDAAVARRRRKDSIAAAVRGRPWLASWMLRLSALSRRTRGKSAVELLLEFPDAQLDALAGAMLSPAAEAFESQEILPQWGQTVPVRVRLGDRVGLRVFPDQDLVDVRYVSNGRHGALPSRTWRLEPGEAPVLLIALVGSTPDSSLAEALSKATAAAGLLLLEAPPIGETSV